MRSRYKSTQERVGVLATLNMMKDSSSSNATNIPLISLEGLFF